MSGEKVNGQKRGEDGGKREGMGERKETKIWKKEKWEKSVGKLGGTQNETELSKVHGCGRTLRTERAAGGEGAGAAAREGNLNQSGVFHGHGKCKERERGNPS